MGKKRVSLWKRRFRRLLTAPTVLFPAVIGGGLSLLAWGSLGTIGVMGLGFLGLAGLVAATKLTIGKDKLTEQAWQDELKRQERVYRDELKSLRKVLRRDRDRHTSGMAKKLRDAFQRMWSLTPDPGEDGSIGQQFVLVDQLYRSCFGLLRRSVELWKAAQTVRTDEARDRLMASRDSVIGQVENSIRHLDATLDHLQTASLGNDESEMTARNQELQDELEKGLEVARAVEQRMEDLEHQLRRIERE